MSAVKLRARLIALNLDKALSNVDVDGLLEALQAIRPNKIAKLNRALQGQNAGLIGAAVMEILRDAFRDQAEDAAKAELSDGAISSDVVNELLEG